MKIIEGKDSQQLDVRIRFDSEEEKQKAFRLLAAMHQKLIGYQRDKEYLLCMLYRIRGQVHDCIHCTGLL